MKRSKFSLSHYKLLTMNPGDLVPVGLVEVLPGDSIQQSTSALVRVAPLMAPVMHRLDVRIHHWFVPNRIIWEDWEDFITGGPDGMDDSSFPTITLDPEIGSLADYLGVPTEPSSLTVSALPFRAYALIYNEWYRDQDLISEVAIDYGSGTDSTTSTTLQQICWEKDYFTSARPWEQKGPSITIPLGTTAPVKSNGEDVLLSAGTGGAVNEYWEASTNDGTMFLGDVPTGGNRVRFGIETGLETDLSNASAVTVNVLREALALQRYEEARARYGSRYTEYLRYLGVKSSDARLQRPEYLGGGKNAIQFSEVLQTAEGDYPVGEMRGHGISAFRSNRYRRFFEEHGFIISLMSIRPKTVYTQGLFRHWNRRTKEDFFQKELQFIGQQEILNKEVYADHTSPDGVFGYQDRYDEYRRCESSVAGEFRDSTLDYWHMARVFGSDPALNGSFVKCTPTDRIYASNENDKCYVMCRHSIQARRLVAQKGTSFTF